MRFRNFRLRMWLKIRGKKREEKKLKKDIHFSEMSKPKLKIYKIKRNTRSTQQLEHLVLLDSILAPIDSLK